MGSLKKDFVKDGLIITATRMGDILCNKSS